MPSYTVEAIVLKRSDFGEKDRLVTLLTPNHGKVRAIAKGVRRPGSRMAGHLELFAHAKVYLAEGRNLDIITQVETLGAHRELRCDLDRVGTAFYLAELGEVLSAEGEKNYPLFHLVKHGLATLSEGADRSCLTMGFEMMLLDILGYRPDLERCSVCAGLLSGAASLCREHSGLLCLECASSYAAPIALTDSTLMHLRKVQHQASFTFERPLASILEETQLAVKHFLMHILSRDLKSEQFLWNVKQLVPAC